MMASTLLRRPVLRGGRAWRPECVVDDERLISTFIGSGRSSSRQSSSSHAWRSSPTNMTSRRCMSVDNRSNNNSLRRAYSAAAAALDDDDVDDDIRGSDRQTPPPPAASISLLLPTKHSRTLPPPTCPPILLRLEVESIFDAPLGSLISYIKPKNSSELKSVEEEIADAYYASDAAVQRAEYVMRGLNARVVVGTSYVSRCIARGTMTYDGGSSNNVNDTKEDDVPLGKEECFRAMLDLLERMSKEGETYAELRTRVRSQVLDPTSTATGSRSSSSSSDSDSSSDDDSDNDEKGEVDTKESDESFERWADDLNENMVKVGIINPAGSSSSSSRSGANDDDTTASTPKSSSLEKYQFGPDPGVTTHMYDLVLDSIACLCHEYYHNKDGSTKLVDLVNLMPEDVGSPPELAKSILDTVLSRHMMDGGDVGIVPMSGVGRGIGVGAGTGAGNLATMDLTSRTFDVRTCPTPISFNAVLRTAANFDPMAYADAIEQARVLGMGSLSTKGMSPDEMRERLRDVTIDAALSTYSRMHDCSALTLRTLKHSNKLATSRSALKRQAKLLDGNTNKGKVDKVSGRNSATYTYLIRTIGNCIPPSLSRGNMAFALYHKGCVEEGIMDEEVVNVMMRLGGYDANSIDESTGVGGDDTSTSLAAPPPISNGPLFDSYMQKEMGHGVKVAMDRGRRARSDRNYKLRRHNEWDSTY